MPIREITSRHTSVLRTRLPNGDVDTSDRQCCGGRLDDVRELLRTVASVYSRSSGLFFMSISMSLVWFLLSFGGYGLLEWYALA